MLVFLALIAGTLLTTAIAFVDLGVLNTPAAMAIAVTKATLVVLYFMHVKYSLRLVWVFAGAGFFWLFILFALAFADYLSRDINPLPGR